MVGKQMEKWIAGIRKNFKSKKGVTMVEMVVTIVLTGILFTMACSMLISWVKVYDELKTTEQAEQLADTLMNKISGEIAGAQTGNIVDAGSAGAGESTRKAIRISTDNQSIELYDRTGSHITIGTTERRPEDGGGRELNIHYEAVKNPDPKISENIYDEIDWKYSTKMYMKYSIESLKFEIVQNAADEILPLVDVTLKIKSGKYGNACTVSKTVECYNSPEITGPVTGGTTEPEPPPVDPEVPPSPPNQEENNSGGYIEVNGGTLSYHAGVPTFQDLKDQADAMKPPNDTEIIKVPQGIYYDESVQRYYYVTEDTITQKYNCGSMAQIKNYTNNWTKVLALNDQLITEDDVIGGDHFGSKLQEGSIYSFGGKYYICVSPSGGWPGVNPENNNNWKQIDNSYFRTGGS